MCDDGIVLMMMMPVSINDSIDDDIDDQWLNDK